MWLIRKEIIIVGRAAIRLRVKPLDDFFSPANIFDTMKTPSSPPLEALIAKTNPTPQGHWDAKYS